MNARGHTLALTVLVAAGASLTDCGGTEAPTASAPGAAPCGTEARGPVVIASGEQGAQAIAIDANNVYWVKTADVSADSPQPPPDGQVLQCAKCGCRSPTVLASNQTIEQFGSGIAVDGTSVYWTSGNVMRVPIGGGPAAVLAVAQTQGAIAVDATSVYWADAGGLMKVAIAGGAPATLVARPDVARIALDTANVYYVGGDGIFKVPLDGGAPTLLAMADNPGTIAVDAVSVYWTNSGLGGRNEATVMKVAIGGGSPTMLASRITSPLGLALDATSLYWTDGEMIMKAPIAGGATTMLLPDNASEFPIGIAVDATGIYWTNGLQGDVVMRLTPK